MNKLLQRNNFKCDSCLSAANLRGNVTKTVSRHYYASSKFIRLAFLKKASIIPSQDFEEKGTISFD